MKTKTLRVSKFRTLPIATKWLVEVFSSKKWMSEKDMSIPMNFLAIPINLQQEGFLKWRDELEEKRFVTLFLKNSKGDKVRVTIVDKLYHIPFITATVQAEDEADSFYREVIHYVKVAEDYWGVLTGQNKAKK